MQIWSAVVVTDPEKRTLLRSYCRDQAFVEEAPLFLLFCGDTYRLREVATRQGYAFNYSRIDFLLAATIDAALACQNAALAAESMGLGCCMVGGVRNRARDVASLFELPKGVYGTIGLAVGYAKQVNNVKARLPANVVVHVDRYSTTHLADGVAQYDRMMAATSIYEGRRVAIPGVTPTPEQFGGSVRAGRSHGFGRVFRNLTATSQGHLRQGRLRTPSTVRHLRPKFFGANRPRRTATGPLSLLIASKNVTNWSRSWHVRARYELRQPSGVPRSRLRAASIARDCQRRGP